MANGLALLFKEAKSKYDKYKQQESEAPDNYQTIRFEEEPPCIRQILQSGVMELGTKNQIQYKLSAFFKLQGLNITQTVAIMDEWCYNITPDKTHEITSQGLTDFETIKKQNRYVCNTVFSSNQYGFSCAGIKSIEGVICDEDCKKKIEEVSHVSLFNADKVENRHKRISVDVEVVGRRDNVVIIPQEITATCNSSGTASDKCAQCPLKGCMSGYKFNINSATNAILHFVEPLNISMSGRIARTLGMSRRECSTWSYKITEQNVERLFISPKLTNNADTNTDEDDRYTKKECYFVGHGIRTNQPYRMYGYSHVSEKDGEVVLVFDKAEELADSLSEFVWTEDMAKDSIIFKPKKSVDIYEKARYIVKQLNSDIFRLWGREDMLLGMYLAWFSLRKIPFQKRIINGWLDILIIGDSGQGKSHAIGAFINHFGGGYKSSGQSSTRSGLLWGIDVKGSGPPVLLWGLLPRYNRRLIVIDEALDLLKEEGAFEQLTEARSAGKVAVNAIISGEAEAQTRLITMTNPNDKMKMNTFIYPCEAIPQLMGRYQNIRRFTFAVGAMSNEVSDEAIHQDVYDIPDTTSEFTSDKCKNLLYWAWSREPEDIIYDRDAQKVTLDLSLDMCKTYSSEIPLVEPSDQRLVLARVAGAFAAGTFSSPDGVKCEITEACVTAAYEYLNKIYSSPALDYKGFSEANAKLVISPSQMKDLIFNFTHNSTWIHHVDSIVKFFMYNKFIKTPVMSAAIGAEPVVVKTVMNWLAAYFLVKPYGRDGYYLTEQGKNFIVAMNKGEGKLGGKADYDDSDLPSDLPDDKGEF